MRPKFVTIREDQDKWLREHKSINFSGFVQEKLDELIKERESDKTKIMLHEGEGSVIPTVIISGKTNREEEIEKLERVINAYKEGQIKMEIETEYDIERLLKQIGKQGGNIK